MNARTYTLESDDIITLTLAAHWPLKQTLALIADTEGDFDDRQEALRIFSELWEEHSESEHMSLYMHMHECPPIRRQANELDADRKHIDQWLKEITVDPKISKSVDAFDHDLTSFVQYLRTHLSNLEDQILPKYFAATRKRDRVLMGLLYLEARSLFENSENEIRIERPRAQPGNDENSGLPH